MMKMVEHERITSPLIEIVPPVRISFAIYFEV